MNFLPDIMAIFLTGVILLCQLKTSMATSGAHGQINWIRKPENGHVKEGSAVVLHCSVEYFKSVVEPSWLKMTEFGFPEYKSIGTMTFDESCKVTGNSTKGEYNMLILNADVERHGGKWRCTHITATPQYWEITLDVESSHMTHVYTKQTVLPVATDSLGTSLAEIRTRADSNLTNQELPTDKSQQQRYSSSAGQEKVMPSSVTTIPYMIAVSMIHDPG